MSQAIALTPTQQASLDLTPVPAGLLPTGEGGSTSFSQLAAFAAWAQQHPNSPVSQDFTNTWQKYSVAPSSNSLDIDPIKAIQQATVDPHTTYETLTNPLGNATVQQVLRNPTVSGATLGLSTDISSADIVATKYLSGQTPEDYQKTEALQGIFKVGAIAATAGVAGYYGAGAADASGAEVESAYAAEGGYGAFDVTADTALSTPYAADVGEVTSEPILADGSVADYSYGDIEAAYGSSASSTGTGLSTYLEYAAVGTAVGSNLLKGNQQGAAAALGVPGAITDLLPGAPGTGGGTVLYPNNYQSSSQPQANSSIPLSGQSTQTKTIVYLAIGLGLLLLLKKVHSHG